MSQRVVFVEVENEIYSEVLTYIPDYDDCVSICQDMDIESGNDIEVHAVWYEIGEGESDTDKFFSDKTLLEWHQKGTFEKEVEKHGYDLVEVQNQSIYVCFEDDEDDGW